MENQKATQSKAEICEKIWIENEVRIRRICNHKLSSYPSEIEDVIGDLHLALCDAVENDKIHTNPDGWMIGTLYNLIRSKYTEMNKTKKKIIPLDNLEEKLMYEHNFDAKNVTEEEIIKVKKEILKGLTPMDREMLSLHIDKKKTYKEIAKKYGMTQPAVKQYFYRLRQQIKDIAEEKFEK